MDSGSRTMGSGKLGVSAPSLGSNYLHSRNSFYHILYAAQTWAKQMPRNSSSWAEEWESYAGALGRHTCPQRESPCCRTNLAFAPLSTT